MCGKIWKELPSGFLQRINHCDREQHPAHEWKGRLQTMSNEKKYTQEEIKAIVNEELRKAGLTSGQEISLDEMENVSGGGYCTYVVPETHEDIDKIWDAIEAIKKAHGMDIAFLSAKELNAYAGESPYRFMDYGTDYYRQRMHDRLDGKLDLNGLDAFSAH